jgi:3-oxoacyl-[acyl-carrier-protein] synthase-3
MAIEIIATGRAVPPRRVTNDELATRLDTSDEWIRSHTGIGSRHIADENVTASDLATEAANAALAFLAERDPALGGSIVEAAATLDLIVVATATADYIGFPSTACLVQDRIGAKKAAAMDVAAGCTGFIYGLDTAAGILTIGKSRKRALVIGAEVLTHIADWSDRSTCVLFGDAAGAAIIEKTEAPSEGPGARGLLRSVLGADGSGSEHLIMRRGGTKFPFKRGETVEEPPYLEMNGQAVYSFAVKAMTETIERLLAEGGIGVADLKWIVPHQANARIVQAAAKRLKIPEAKCYLNIEEYANTSAATIPLALDELARTGGIVRGDLILTVAFGAGLTYGGNLIIW